MAAGASPLGTAPPVRTDQPTVISQRTPIPGPLNVAPSNPAELGRTLLGQKLDHFELLEYVGGGGMGAVFKALDTRLNRIVALKVLARDQADEEEKVRRFQNEAQSAARLDHDHIARVYFVGQDCGLHYIVFEYIEGINLRELVERKGPLPLDEAVSFTLQIAEALAHASGRDVVHRDIKPSNVLITPQGRAKLVDMGLARLHQVEHSRNDLTSSGVTLGTFDYISPEQARDPRSADVRSDIYSLGCTLYFMLTGRPPFPEGNVLQKLLQHNNDPPPDPAEYYPELPEVVSRLVRKMLAKDPRKRHQTAGELVAELLGIFEHLGLSVPGVDAISWTTPKPSRFGGYERHLPWFAPLALLLAIVLALDFWSPAADLPDIDAALRDDRVPRARLAPDDSQPQAPAANRDEDAAASTLSQQGADAASIGALPFTTTTVTSDAEAAGTTLPGSTSMAPNPAMFSAIESRLSDATAAGTLQMPPTSAGLSIEGGAQLTEPGETAKVEYSAPAAESTAGSQTGAVNTAAPAPTAARPGVLVVSRTAMAPHEHATLQKACAVAKEKGIDVIELQFNGRLEEKPLRLNNQKLTIRAAENCQPVIVFRPQGIAISDWQPMISIVGGQLTLVNVAIEFEVSRNLQPQGWALFETQRPESVRLERCSLTIRNANDQGLAMHPEVAFFDIKAPPDSTAMEMNSTAVADPAVAIRLDDCIARGEATLLRTLQSQPVSLSWTNGLLATSERLLRAAGGDMPPRQGGIISVDLRHITAAVKNGLCQLSSAEGGGPLLHTEIKCSDSILVSGGTAPLVEQFGMNLSGELEDQFNWSGSRYFFSGIHLFWRISTLGMSHPPVERRFDQWQDYWQETAEDNAMWSQVEWKRLPDSRPYHTHTAADYALAEASETNRARGGASDGLDAGFQAEKLPTLPATFPADASSSSSAHVLP
jgi:serine/threonine-protein kinase